MTFFLVLFWFFSFNREFLFWIYLWQLKEYHFGRFFAHFETEKGKRILLNKILFLKLAIVIFYIVYTKIICVYCFNLCIDIFSFFYPLITILSLFIFLFESFLLFFKLFKKTLKIPFFTKKVILIFVSGLFFQALMVFLLIGIDEITLLLYLLISSILVPLFSTLIVFLWHPISYFWRINLIKRAKRKIEKMENLLVVGITGSYGKTSTKEFLSTILSSKYNVLKTREHQNSEVGISKCILNDLKEEHEVFVCEMGAYNKGGIKMLSDIVHPQIGVLTGINQQHMSTFGSQENITKTKFELIESLPKNGLAVLNGDNKIIKEEYNKRNFKVKKRFLYSIKEKLDFFAEDIKEDSFRVSSKKGESALFNIKVPGNFNILNILASVAVSNHLGISLKEISKNSLGINFEKAGTKIEKRGEFNIIDATYSSNPDGIISHLEFLKTFQGNKALIMPCLIELGKSSKEVHQKIGKKIGEVCDLAIITTKERIEEIKKGSELSLNKKTKEIIFLKDGFSIKNKLKEFSIKTILLESRIPKGIIKDIFKL